MGVLGRSGRKDRRAVGEFRCDIHNVTVGITSKLCYDEHGKEVKKKQISSRFTMAIHMFACIDTFSDQKMTSDFMAASIGTNPVIVRKLLQQLKAAGLVEVSRGTGGVTITKSLDQITFLDIYKAVECAPDEELFHFHENPNQNCPVGKNIHHVLDHRLLEVQRAMEEKLSEMTLADVKKDVAAYMEKEQ